MSMISEATFVRAVSQEKDLRVKLSELYGFLEIETNTSLMDYIDELENALYS